MTTSRFTTWTFIIFFLLSLILVIHLLFDYITPVVIAIAIVSVFNPLYQKLLRSLKNRDYLAASIATTLVLLGVLIPLSIFIVLLFQQALSLFVATQQFASPSDIADWITALRNYLDSFNNFLAKFNLQISSERIVKLTKSLFEAIGAWFYQALGLVAKNILSLSFNFILTIALVFVFFISGKSAKKFVMDLVPLPNEDKQKLIKRFNELVKAIFIGNGLISVLEGVLGGLSFLIFDIPGALIWGVVMAVTAFLPVVGASIVVIPAAIYLFIMDKTWQGVVFLVFNTIQITILDTFIKPRVIGTQSQMHAVLIFMAIIAGVQIYGMFGLFYGPLLITIFLALSEMYKEHYRNELLKY